MKKILLFLLITLTTYLNAQNITGYILDAQSKKGLEGAAIAVKESNEGTYSDVEGKFTIVTGKSFPVTLVASMVGYQTKEIIVDNTSIIRIELEFGIEELDQLVVSASRVEERLLRSPISIEKMDQRSIQQAPSANFYDALVNFKSLDMVTSSLTFKQINTRGFNDTGNGRFLQLVDGMDNQSAGLGFAMGNLFGPHDLDVHSVELIPGAASALYGPVAFNGMLHMITKNPFDYEGLSVQTKVGVNHVKDGTDEGSKPLFDLGLRYAKVFGKRFAFKVNAAYLTGTDWYANDYTDIDPNTPEANRGPNNPGKNSLNIYGDEVAQTLEGIGRVSRTGYEEEYLATYDVYNLKLNAALHYRITDNLEAIYQGNFNQGVAQYTGSSRFVINGFNLFQHRLELKGSNFYLKGYSTREDSQDSYNTRSLGQLINRSWVKDLNGSTVSPELADATWFQRYSAAFNGMINGVTPNNHGTARLFADDGRLIPGSAEFESTRDRLIHTQGLQGAGIFSKCGIKHVEGMYDFSSVFHDVLDVQIGANYRIYDLNTEGTLFDDKGKNLTNDEVGAFIQLSKNVLKERLRLIMSGRYDKNENFEGRFTPRASAVYSINEDHHFRLSYQTGFRNPTIGDQYIKLDVGPIIILGGAPVNSEGLNAYENSFTAASVGAFGSAFGAQVGQGVPFQTALANNIDLLVKSNVPYIKPERVSSIEVGYKALIKHRLLLDIGYYFSRYQDFLINTVVIRPDNPVITNGSINPAATADILDGKIRAFQLYTNAADKVSIQGISTGFTYFLPKNYRLHGNVSWSDFNLLDADPNNIPAFNTPQWKTNIVFSNPTWADRWSYSLAWHWQSAFDWYGTFTSLSPGKIPAYSLFDAQISYKIPTLKTTVKLGASNLFNNYVVQAYGSPAVGGIYYLSLNFDQLFH